MRYQSLDAWLRWQETLHPQLVDLGLERIKQVFQRLHSQPPPFTVITVAGTNGKGSTVALLESIFLSAGYRVGAYTSPHLLRYNERIRVDSQPADDEHICAAFERIDGARGDISLTYFEFGTLAALDLFYRTPLDIVLLEVGLGGRLDAVNIIDSDVALITSIGLDHTDWLGKDRQSIAREKAGIMRSGKPVICSDDYIPEAIYTEAERIGSHLFCLGRDFHYQLKADSWSWSGSHSQLQALSLPALGGEHQLRNAAGVMRLLECLATVHPVSHQDVLHGLRGLHVTGRQQIIAGQPEWILDVAHNAQSAEALAAFLRARPGQARVHAIVGMLQDKDIPAVLKPLLPYVSHWHCVDLAVPRGATAGKLQVVLRDLSASADIRVYANVSEAMVSLQNSNSDVTTVLVFGSFYTVAEALQRGV